jgi:hypothetical protein
MIMVQCCPQDCDVTVKFYTTRSLTQIIFQLQGFKNSAQDIIQFLSFGGIKKKLPVHLLFSYFFLVNYHFIFLSIQMFDWTWIWTVALLLHYWDVKSHCTVATRKAVDLQTSRRPEMSPSSGLMHSLK